MSTKIAIIDIDGTIANIDHRLHLITGDVKLWDEFHKACVADAPIDPMITLVNNIYEDYYIVLCTGRMETNRDATIDWLHTHDVPYNELRMRKDNDHRADTIIKPEMFTPEELSRTHFTIDDRKSVIDMWREKGLLALHCAEGDF